MMTTYTAIRICEELKIDMFGTIVLTTSHVNTIFGTTANLKPGQKLSINDLFYGTMLPSGNDAAFTLANFLGNKL